LAQTNPCCYGNENWLILTQNSACIRDITQYLHPVRVFGAGLLKGDNQA